MGSTVDNAWDSWAHDNLSRGVARAELCDEMLIAGFEASDASAVVRKEFEALRQRAGKPASEPSLSPGMTHIVHAGRGGTIHEITNFLIPDECSHLLRLSGEELAPSTILGSENPRYVRTSKTAQIGLSEDPLIDVIEERLGGLLGLPRAFSEPLQLHAYARDAFFANHTDYLPEARLDAFDVAFGQRTYSILIYVQAPHEGGLTVFPELGISIVPRPGSLVFWHNLTENEEINPATLHRSEPVRRGEKVILTKWFRLPSPKTHLQFPGERVEPPAFPFGSAQIEAALLQQMRGDLCANAYRAERETIDSLYLRSNNASEVAPSRLIPMSEDTKTAVARNAAELITAATGLQVSDPLVYGIRQYNPGASLRLHFDRQQSHHAAVLYCIERSNTQPWPFFIEQERGLLTAADPQAGEALIFAGSSVLHGRPRPLVDGHVYNVFAHFRLVSNQ